MCGGEEKENEQSADETERSCRWRWGDGEINLRREDSKCAECGSGEVEAAKHFSMRCKAWDREREDT